jgi:N-acetylmuramoyl-L-alanine amidase
MPNFAPDSPLVDRVVPSPNHGPRRGGARPTMILLHYTGMRTAEVALERLCQNGSEVSAHYVVLENGEVLQCVAEARRAWHAGEAFWAGESDINSHSIGIEIVNPGHDWGYDDFPPAQINAVTALCRDVLARNAIPHHRLLAHSDVAPGRKQDPGEKFPWARLAAAGIGHWVAPEPIGAGGVLALDDMGPDVCELQAQLSQYGYRVGQTGTYDAQTRDAVVAFQRHFRPERVDGVADASTCATLARLLATRMS